MYTTSGSSGSANRRKLERALRRVAAELVGTTWIVTCGCFDCSSRNSSCSFSTRRPPIGRCSTDSSITAHSWAGSGR